MEGGRLEGVITVVLVVLVAWPSLAAGVQTRGSARLLHRLMVRNHDTDESSLVAGLADRPATAISALNKKVQELDAEAKDYDPDSAAKGNTSNLITEYMVLHKQIRVGSHDQGNASDVDAHKKNKIRTRELEQLVGRAVSSADLALQDRMRSEKVKLMQLVKNALDNVRGAVKNGLARWHQAMQAKNTKQAKENAQHLLQIKLGEAVEQEKNKAQSTQGVGAEERFMEVRQETTRFSPEDLIRLHEEATQVNGHTMTPEERHAHNLAVADTVEQLDDLMEAVRRFKPQLPHARDGSNFRFQEVPVPEGGAEGERKEEEAHSTEELEAEREEEKIAKEIGGSASSASSSAGGSDEDASKGLTWRGWSQSGKSISADVSAEEKRLSEEESIDSVQDKINALGESSGCVLEECRDAKGHRTFRDPTTRARAKEEEQQMMAQRAVAQEKLKRLDALAKQMREYERATAEQQVQVMAARLKRFDEQNGTGASKESESSQ